MNPSKTLVVQLTSLGDQLTLLTGRYKGQTTVLFEHVVHNSQGFDLKVRHLNLSGVYLEFDDISFEDCREEQGGSV